MEFKFPDVGEGISEGEIVKWDEVRIMQMQGGKVWKTHDRMRTTLQI